jgi:hypothetical protein
MTQKSELAGKGKRLVSDKLAGYHRSLWIYEDEDEDVDINFDFTIQTSLLKLKACKYSLLFYLWRSNPICAQPE